VPLSKDSYLALKEKVKDLCTLDTSLLRQYLEQRKRVQPLVPKEALSKARALLLVQHPLNTQNRRLFKPSRPCCSSKAIAPIPFGFTPMNFTACYGYWAL
jgi:hypothetical protein